ncbi:MAG: hypothetical protein ACF8PN_05205 [Phycisphaerales bacterium]
MLLGRDSPGKAARVERVREWVHARSPFALAAGGLGVVAPIDGIFILPAVASIVMGVIGWSHLNRTPHLLGRRLCALGVVGGIIGLGFAAFLHTWDGGVEPRETTGAPVVMTPQG